MATPNQPNTVDANITQLIDTLHKLRNTLVKASLQLHDYQFEVDSVQRASAAEHSAELIEKIKPKN